jgi:hypothetical protein
MISSDLSIISNYPLYGMSSGYTELSVYKCLQMSPSHAEVRREVVDVQRKVYLAAIQSIRTFNG